MAPKTLTSGGSSGSGPAVITRLAASSSGASGAHACHASTSAAASVKRRSKAVASGAGTVRNVNEVTIPKRPPPAPRSAQNSSGSRCSSHSTSRPPSATVAPTSESEVSPWRRPMIPSPPPSVSPAIPTSGPQPAGIVTPCSSRAS